MRSRNLFLALVIVSSSLMPTADVDAGWAAVTKV
jgi:hypothetical protein